MIFFSFYRTELEHFTNHWPNTVSTNFILSAMCCNMKKKIELWLSECDKIRWQGQIF